MSKSALLLIEFNLNVFARPRLNRSTFKVEMLKLHFNDNQEAFYLSGNVIQLALISTEEKHQWPPLPGMPARTNLAFFCGVCTPAKNHNSANSRTNVVNIVPWEIARLNTAITLYTRSLYTLYTSNITKPLACFLDGTGCVS